MIPKVKPHNRVKPTRAVNVLYLKNVSELPCCVCGGHPCQSHHPISTDSRRKFGKAHDYEAIPLCFHHHSELHDIVGNETTFMEMYHLELYIVISQTQEILSFTASDRF